MDIRLKPWKGNEKLYFYPQTTQISGQTGLIGKLRADFDTDGTGFYSSWDDVRGYLKTEDFKQEFDEVINYLRFEADGTPIANRKALTIFLRNKDGALLPNDGEWHGFRADTDNYSYLFRLKSERGDYNLYCYCFKKDWLDQHLHNSERGIRFISSDYEDKFRVADGDKIRVTYSDGTKEELTARYVDEYHVEIGSGVRSNLYHICEYAEKLENAGAKVEPVNEPVNLINARYYCPLILSVFERNDYGDLDDECTDYGGRACVKYEDTIRSLCENEHSYDGCDPKSMASYQDNPKVRSVEFDVDEINNTLYGCIRCQFSAPLTATEEKQFKGWLEGQCSNGFGEGLGQREFDTDDGGIATVGFWSCESDYFMKNENEFREYIRNNNTMKIGGM